MNEDVILISRAKPESVRPEQPKVLFTLALLVIVFWGAAYAKPFLMPVCLSALLAFMAAPLVRWLGRYRVPDWIAIVAGSIVMILPFFFFGYMLAQQVISLVQVYPSMLPKVEAFVQHLSQTSIAHKLGFTDSLNVQSLVEKIFSGAGESIGVLAHWVGNLLAIAMDMVLILLFAILMLASRKHLRKCSEKILSRFEGLEAAKMVDSATALIEHFLITKMVIVIYMGIATFIFLEAYSFPYAFLLSGFVGILTVVPEIGFFVSIIPIFVVALFIGTTMVNHIILMSVLMVLHLIDGNILTPKLVGKKLNLNVLATFIGIFGGGLLWGVGGMFLSIPILGLLRIAFSVAPSLQPWGELLAEREDDEATRGLLKTKIFSKPVEE